MASLIREVGETTIALVKGFGVTFKNMLAQDGDGELSAPTGEFPTALPRHSRVAPRRVRLGKVRRVLPVRRRMPSNCIYIEAARKYEATRISAGERYAKVYNIDYSRCIFCGYYVEACPTDAITHGHGFELATYDINSLVYRKEQMLESTGGKPPAGSLSQISHE